MDDADKSTFGITLDAHDQRLGELGADVQGGDGGPIAGPAGSPEAIRDANPELPGCRHDWPRIRPSRFA
jgi:hypothetical protein